MKQPIENVILATCIETLMTFQTCMWPLTQVCHLVVLPLLSIYVVSEAPCTRVLAPTFEIPARALSAMHTVF